MDPEQALPNLKVALGYARRLGWRLIPILENEKRPAMNNWTEFATTDEALIAKWWTQFPDRGIGVVTGLGSGIFVLDVDVSDGKHGDDTLADLEATYGKLPDTAQVITGSGGMHFYFRMPAGVTITNDAGRRLGPGLDVRGEGGQVLAPPTIHPNGRRYHWDALLNPGTVGVAEAPAWLVALLVAVPEPAGARRTLIARTGTDMLPGDIYAATHSWPELLLADGAAYLGTRIDRTSGAPYELWSRPGVDHASATLYFGGSDVLKVFSSAWEGLDTEATYSRFGYFTATRHHGNHEAAAAALAAEQLRAGKKRWYDELRKEGRDPEEPIRVTYSNNPLDDTSTSVPVEGPWEDPLPMPVEASLPPFDVNNLPTWLGAFARAEAYATQTPVDLAAVLCLGALAAVAGGRVVVEVSDGWREPTNLFLVVAMPPGTRKSAVFQAVSRPLFEVQRDNGDSVRSQLIEARSARKAAVKARDLAEGDWARATDDGKDRASDRLKAAAQLAESITLPTMPRLLADDATPEALGSLMAEQGGRIAVLSAEGDVFDLMAGRYSGAPNLGIYLKGHAGDPYVLDRKGRDPEYIKAPALTMGLAVQPDVLQAIAVKPGFRGRGLLARFLYSMPRSSVGERLIDVEEVSRPTRMRYESTLKTLAASLSEWSEPMVLTLTTEAREALRAFQREVEPRLGAEADLEGIVEWASKLAGACVRIAGLLHLAEHEGVGYRRPIEATTMHSALAIGHYFVAHAHVAFATMATTAALYADADAVLKMIRRHHWSTFRQRDLQRLMMNRFPLVSYLVPVMELLVDYGYLRQLVAPRLMSGRPTISFRTHPRWV